MKAHTFRDNDSAFPAVNNVRKEEEFKAFLRMIRKGKIEHWFVVAEALGVRPATISEWKKHPLARKAIAQGIINGLEKMEEAGEKDWRMWREKLKILGVQDKKTDSNSSFLGFSKEEYVW